MARKAGKTEASAPSSTGRAFGVIWRTAWLVAAWVAAPVLLAGLAVRLTVRDDLEWLAPFYYATPWAVLTTLAVICFVHWWPRPRIRIVNLVVLAGCLAMFAYSSFGFAPVPKTPAAFRIAYWNVARPEWRLDRILRLGDQMNADFFVFGEHRQGPRTPPAWQEHFNGRFVLPLARELLLISPTEVKREGGGTLGHLGGYQLYRAKAQGRDVFLLMVDFTASIHRSRRPPFDALLKTVAAYADLPLIVIGDFNTPSDSVYFDRLRSHLTSAFETAGRGYAATWPMPLPVLQLDHIWTSKHLRVLRCEHRASIYSDHRAVIADIAFP